jgi:hypothetical protein
MDSLIIVVVFAVLAFLIAWIGNGLIGWLSGEKPGDTGSLWLETFARFFGILELGFIGRMLNYVGVRGWPRKLVLFIGLVCVLLFLVKACQHSSTPEYIYPARPA